MRKLFSMLVVLAMVLVFGTTALAAEGSGSITVVNAELGQQYALYKVFDATYGTDNAAYTYTASGEADPFLAALSATVSPFTLTQIGETNTYSVALTGDITAIKDFLNANKDNLAKIGDTVTGSGDAVTFDNLGYGYYFVTTTLGTAVSIDNVNDNISIIDKNQAPDFEDPDGPDGGQQNGKNVSADGSTWAATSTANIGDTVYFKINAYAPLFHKDKLVTRYIFTDTLDGAFDYNEDMKVMAGETDITDDCSITPSTVDGKTQITITINVDGDTWATDTHLEFTYTALLTAEAVHDNVNTISMTWTETTPDPDDPTTPDNPDDPGNPPEEDTPNDPETHTYTYGFHFQKVTLTCGLEENEEHAHTEDCYAALDNAEFELEDAAGNVLNFTYDQAAATYTLSDSAAEGATATLVAGNVKVFGLDLGSYTLTETKAPEGYNQLAAPLTVVLAADSTAMGENGILEFGKILNNAGTVLPETGGIGTTIFYIVGGLMMVGAVVLLITKKKLSAKAE